jgi:hypothetical protein
VRQPTAPTLPLKLRGYGTSRWQLCSRSLTVPNAFDKAMVKGAAIVQSLRPSGPIKIAPPIKRGSRDSDLLQCPPNRQMGLLDDRIRPQPSRDEAGKACDLLPLNAPVFG